MGFSIQWDDEKEAADDSSFMEKCSLKFIKKHVKAEAFEDDDASNLVSHMFIHGDNYPVLKLLEKKYEGKVDFIYIDPPYNTGKSSFIYNDALFSERKNEKSGKIEKDRHSSWLSFMSRRLTEAKKLLSESGCIFIAIGKEELYQLKLLCDQIFGEENFVNDFMWLHGKGKKDAWSRTLEESNLCYGKNKKKLLPFSDFEVTDWADSNADNDPRGNWFSGSISFNENRSSKTHPNYYEIVSPSGIKWKRQWLLPESKMKELLKNNLIYFGKAPEYSNVPRQKIFNGEMTEIIPKNIIEFAESTRQAQNHVDELLGEKNAFDNPKSVALIQHLMKITSMKKDALVMDFFGGSGTTFEAALSLNQEDGGKRRCIIVQKPEVISARTSRFKTISCLCLERMRLVLGKGDCIEEFELHAD